MFEREIQRAKELLTQRMNAAAQYVYWDEIRRRADIPVFYRNFFGAEAQWWIFERQMQRSANPRFDYTNETVTRLIGELDQYLLESARFDHQDLSSTIDLAVKTRFNYVLRPRTTLKWFVFRGEPTKTLSEIILRMDYFLEYDYLLDGVRRWMSDKQNDIAQKEQSYIQSTESVTKPDAVRHFSPTTSLVSVVEFDRVLQNVDNDVILEYSPEEFTDLLTPLFEMFDEIHSADRALQQYRGKVPTPALIIFLDDKGIYRIAQELEELMKTRGLRYVGQREFMHVLNDIVAKLELAIANNELPKPAPIEDTATLPLDFARGEEPILKADDMIGELAIGTAIRTKKRIMEEGTQKSTKNVEKEAEEEENTAYKNADDINNQATIHQTPSKQDRNNSVTIQTGSQEPTVIDVEFEITEPAMMPIEQEKSVLKENVQPAHTETDADRERFVAQAADLAKMFNNLNNDAPSARKTEDIQEVRVTEIASEIRTTIGATNETSSSSPQGNPEPRNNFFTRWGSIFGTPRGNE